MARRKLSFDPEECYHIYNRGNDKNVIFFENKNYSYFLGQLAKHLPRNAVQILAYVLMPNHYHLLLRLVKSADVSKAMKNFSISYVKSVNNLYGKVGHLFQGEFKAKHVDSFEYLLHLSRYIHMNPVFAGLARKPEEWKFSSYSDYLKRRENSMTTAEYILSHFHGIDDYRSFVEELPSREYEKIEGSL